jgi:hypothetical protein
MGIVKNEHGVYCVRRKVPTRLQEATATVTGASRSRQVWLKQSLKTKDQREAKRLARHSPRSRGGHFEGSAKNAAAVTIWHVWN